MVREQAKRQTGMFSRSQSSFPAQQPAAAGATPAAGFPKGFFLTVLMLAIVGGPQLFPQYFPEKFYWKTWFQRPVRTTASNPTSATPGMVRLKIELAPGPGATRVFLNGQEINSQNPVGEVRVGDNYEVVVDRDGYTRLEHHGALTADQVRGNEATLKLVPVPIASGTVSLYSSPFTASVDIYSVDESKKIMTVQNTPSQRLVLPAGTYKFIFRNENLGARSQVVETIRREKHIDIKMNLSPNE
jgi:hypothetical protein